MCIRIASVLVEERATDTLRTRDDHAAGTQRGRRGRVWRVARPVRVPSRQASPLQQHASTDSTQGGGGVPDGHLRHLQARVVELLHQAQHGRQQVRVLEPHRTS